MSAKTWASESKYSKSADQERCDHSATVLHIENPIPSSGITSSSLMVSEGLTFNYQINFKQENGTTVNAMSSLLASQWDDHAEVGYFHIHVLQDADNLLYGKAISGGNLYAECT